VNGDGGTDALDFCQHHLAARHPAVETDNLNPSENANLPVISKSPRLARGETDWLAQDRQFTL